MLSSIKIRNFTGFDDLTIKFAPGMNIFVGSNGIGKSNLLKILYSACAITSENSTFPQKLNNVFYPTHKDIGRLVKRFQTDGEITVRSDSSKISAKFASKMTDYEDVKVRGVKDWLGQKITTAFIPIQPFIANRPGFNSLYSLREIHFEEIYNDIILKASLPVIKTISPAFKDILAELQKIIGGPIKERGDEFYRSNKSEGDLELTLLSTGLQKLSLLWLLIRNGTIAPNSILFWDTPEFGFYSEIQLKLAEILSELQNNGVQLFITTYSYDVADNITANKSRLFHYLKRDKDNIIRCESDTVFLDFI